MSKSELKVAVVGLGKMGLLHACILNTMPSVELSAVCEKSGFTRKLFKKIMPNIPIVGDVSEFSGLGLDAVYVTTPISSHFSVAKAVLQDKLADNLFMEKPLTSNYTESKELCELMAKTGGVNMVGYLRRFMVTFMKAKELLSKNTIGDPLSFDIRAFSSDFVGVNGNGEITASRGGVLKDLGSYALDLTLWFFGDIQVDSAKIESLTGEGSEDAVHFTAQRELGDLQGEVSVSWCEDGYRMPEVVVSVKGSKGALEVNDDKVSLNLNNGHNSTWYRHNLNDNVDFWLGGPEYFREDMYFIKSITNHSSAEPSFETASKVDLLIETLHKKADRHE
jgi:predicted dehydrogenase